MKRFLILLAALCCTLPMAAQWGRRPTPNDTLQSTRVLPDGKVLFQIYAPEAKTVSVSGDLPWDKPIKFEKAENGVWKGICGRRSGAGPEGSPLCRAVLPPDRG